jgi:small subunit ribosomal protein S2
MRQLLEAGVHFGHQTHRWNPRMKPFIYGERSGIHIMDLSHTVPSLHQALVFVRDTVAKGGRILFVGTKRQAQDPVAEAAARCAQYYMNHRWLGGTLTNWTTVSNSIKQLRELNTMFDAGGGSGLTKKELLDLQRRRDKLQRALGGIADMGGLPAAIIVIDTNKEAIAVQEADFGFPGNDDAARAISLYCNLFADAVLDGLAESTAGLGVDLGAMSDVGSMADADVKVAGEAASDA